MTYNSYPLFVNTEPEDVRFPDESIPASESLDIDMPNVQLMFEVENLDYNVPRLCVKSEVKAELHDWSTQLRSRADVTIDVSYYNDELSVWEPLVEPVMVHEDQYRPWNISLKVLSLVVKSTSVVREYYLQLFPSFRI